MGNLVFQATLGGQVNLVGPNTASTFNLNVPAVAGTLVTTGDTGTVTNTMLATSAYTAPGTIGSGTANTGAFTTLSASSTVSGTGFSTYLASPPAIGGTAAAAGAFTTLTGSTSVTTPIVKSASSLTLQSNGTTTAMTIDTSQNVGIGTASPATKLDVNGNIALPNATALQFKDSGGSRKDTLQLNSSSNIILQSPSASIFQINGSTEAMRLTSAGFLCINATSTTYNETLRINTANQQGIHINDTTSSSSINYQYFTKGSGPTNVGAIYYNGSVMAYQTTSDYRLKENIAPITNALNKIALLNPVTYTWKDNQQSGEGFIAHELQEHFPDAVSGTKDGVDEKGNPKYQGMDASVLIAAMVKAIQELKAINDTQAATITALTARIVALEAK